LHSFLQALAFLCWKIIGGHEANPHSRPYMAFLRIYKPDKTWKQCGGFLVQGTPGTPPFCDTSQVLTVKLTSAQVRPGTVCSVAGWGQFRMDSSSGAEKLHEVELEIRKDEQCMSHYNHLYNHATQMCVGNPRRKNLSSLCPQGDSGGPLVCNNVAQGIVSCVKHCGTPPLVYTRISGFMHWIEKIMRHFSPPGPDSDASRINPSTFSGAEARTALGKGGGEEAARDLINFHL
uniref:Granzyme B-like n=1 Tax=Lynx canadensis TaxID=61383 RepID=A0A667I0X3_LYNCA